MGSTETRGPHDQPPLAPEAGVESMLRALMMPSSAGAGRPPSCGWFGSLAKICHGTVSLLSTGDVATLGPYDVLDLSLLLSITMMITTS